MNFTGDFQFLQPLWLWLLLPLWLLIWVYSARAARSSMWQRTCDPHLLAAMTSTRKEGTGPGLSVWILACVLSIGVIAAAAPSWSRLSQPIMEVTSARVIVFDLSRSMLVQDIKPNRYQHALAAASEIIGDGFAGETGLVVFAESAFVLSPLSRDADSLLAFIEAVNPQTMPQDGSNLSRAMAAGLDLLAASLSGQGQLLLISAGDSKDQGAVQLAIDAAAQGHRISVLAIGSDAGGPLPDARGGLQRDANGQTHISKTNFALLQRIAAAGNGRLVIVGATGYEIDLLGSRIDAGELVEAQRDAEQSAREASNDGVWLVWFMLPLTLLLFRRNLLWMWLLVVFLPVPQDADASDVSSMWTHPETIALEAYRHGDYERARELSNNPLVLGASYYRSGQFILALEQFGLDDSASARYNQANTLVQLQRYPEAMQSYQQAIDLDPGLSNARYNQRLLQIYLEQQAENRGGFGGCRRWQRSWRRAEFRRFV